MGKVHVLEHLAAERLHWSGRGPTSYVMVWAAGSADPPDGPLLVVGPALAPGSVGVSPPDGVQAARMRRSPMRATPARRRGEPVTRPGRSTGQPHEPAGPPDPWPRAPRRGWRRRRGGDVRQPPFPVVWVDGIVDRGFLVPDLERQVVDRGSTRKGEKPPTGARSARARTTAAPIGTSRNTGSSRPRQVGGSGWRARRRISSQAPGDAAWPSTRALIARWRVATSSRSRPTSSRHAAQTARWSRWGAERASRSPKRKNSMTSRAMRWQLIGQALRSSARLGWPLIGARRATGSSTRSARSA